LLWGDIIFAFEKTKVIELLFFLRRKFTQIEAQLADVGGKLCRILLEHHKHAGSPNPVAPRRRNSTAFCPRQHCQKKEWASGRQTTASYFIQSLNYDRTMGKPG
jgi:hypothetical protein